MTLPADSGPTNSGPTDAGPTVSLVTGANKGIGRQIAQQLAEAGHRVVIAARDAQLGEQAATELRADGAEASAVVLDVTDPASATAAAAAVDRRYGRLDVLVNNAGVARPPGYDLAAQQPRSADLGAVRAIFETNVFGVITVTNAFLPLLQRSDNPRIVNMSSSSGSLAARADPERAATLPLAVGYAPSKAALNAVTLLYAQDLRADGFLVNAVCPGHVATDLNNFSGPRTPAQGAIAAVRMATLAPGGPTGTFTDEAGVVAW